MSQERIDIVVSERGARVVRRSIEDIGQSATKTSSAVSLLKKGLTAFGAAYALNKLNQISDSFITLEKRVQNVSDTLGDADKNLTKLYKIAQRDGSQVSGLADSFVKLNVSVSDTIRDTVDLTDVTDILARGFAAAGASAQTATGATLQLTQGLATNFRAAGQELNSIIEGAPLLAKAIAEQIGGKGTAAVALKDLAEQGKLTTEAFLQAILAARETIFSFEIPATVDRSLTRLKNAFTFFIGESPKVKKVVKAVTSAIDTLSENLDVLYDAVSRVATAFAVFAAVDMAAFLTQKVKYVAGVLTMNTAMATTTAQANLQSAALTKLTGTLATTSTASSLLAKQQAAVAATAVPAYYSYTRLGNSVAFFSKKEVAAASATLVSTKRLGGLRGAWTALKGSMAGVIALVGGWPTIILASVAALVVFSDKIKIAAGSMTTLADVGNAAFDLLKASASEAASWFGTMFSAILESATGLAADIKITFKGFVDVVSSSVSFVVGIFAGLSASIVAAFETAFNKFKKLWNDYLVKPAEDSVNDIIKAINKIRTFFKQDPIEFVEFGSMDYDENAKTLGQNMKDSFLLGLEGTQEGVQTAVDNLFELADAKSAENAAADQLKKIQEKQKALIEIGGSPGTSGSISDLLGTGEGGGKDKLKTFSELLSDLEKENELLKLNSDERMLRYTTMDMEEQLSRKLTDAETAQVSALLEENEALYRQSSLLDDIKGPQEDIQKNMEALNALYDSGKISVDQYTDSMRQLQYQLAQTSDTIEGGITSGLLRIGDEFKSSTGLIEDAFVDTFSNAEDVMVDFFATGEANFSDFVDSIMADITRIAVRNAITSPLASLLSGTSSSSTSSSGTSSVFSSLLSGLGTSISSLFGFASGGSFAVSQGTAVGNISGGVDNRLVAFRARDGEEVSVTRPGQSKTTGGARNTNNVSFNISTPNADSFKRSQGQMLAKMQTSLNRANKRNN